MMYCGLFGLVFSDFCSRFLMCSCVLVFFRCMWMFVLVVVFLKVMLFGLICVDVSVDLIWVSVVELSLIVVLLFDICIVGVLLKKLGNVYRRLMVSVMIIMIYF